MAESTGSQDQAQKEGTKHKDQRQMMSCSRAQGVRKRRFRLRPLLTQLPVSPSLSSLSRSSFHPGERGRRRNRKQRSGEREEGRFDQEGGRCAEGFVGTRGGMTERGERNRALMACSPFISLSCKLNFFSPFFSRDETALFLYRPFRAFVFFS
jgi:hypothetical protein